MQNKLIVIFGASGSGKSTLANEIANYLGRKNTTIISQDDYYIGIDDMEVNSFDEPESLDFELLESNVQDLLNNKSIESPIYNFSTHKRELKVNIMEPNNLIILDGTMVCVSDKIKQLSDFTIYCNIELDISFIRRLSRDIRERDRETNGVIKQYLDDVRPAFFKYIYPYKENANFNYNETNKNELFDRLKIIL